MEAVSRGPRAHVSSDGAIIEQSLREPEQFAAIFDRYYHVIHGYAARRLGPGLADDVAAETFLIAFSARRKYDLSRQGARPWLYGIASNLISRHVRAEIRQYRALARACIPATAGGDPDRIEARLDAQALRRTLAAVLADIPRGDRDVLLLVAWAGLTSAEAGRGLGIPAGTARSRLHRARKRIREALSEHGMVNMEGGH
jgi:RNA polymerase sigma factor (sigma-70 family)